MAVRGRVAFAERVQWGQYGNSVEQFSARLIRCWLLWLIKCVHRGLCCCLLQLYGAEMGAWGCASARGGRRRIGLVPLGWGARESGERRDFVWRT